MNFADFKRCLEFHIKNDHSKCHKCRGSGYQTLSGDPATVKLGEVDLYLKYLKRLNQKKEKK